MANLEVTDDSVTVALSAADKLEALITFAVCHGRKPATVMELTGQPYGRIVATITCRGTASRIPAMLP